jgi:hypothetical protein
MRSSIDMCRLINEIVDTVTVRQLNRIKNELHSSDFNEAQWKLVCNCIATQRQDLAA